MPSTFWSSALHYWKATQGPAPKQEQKVPAAPAQMSSPASMPDELLRSVLQVVESRCVATSAVVCRRWRTLVRQCDRFVIMYEWIGRLRSSVEDGLATCAPVPTNRLR